MLRTHRSGSARLRTRPTLGAPTSRTTDRAPQRSEDPLGRNRSNGGRQAGLETYGRKTMETIDALQQRNGVPPC